MSRQLVDWLNEKLERNRLERDVMKRPVCDAFEAGVKCVRHAEHRIRCNACGRLVGLCCGEHVGILTGPMEYIDLICGHDGPGDEIHTVEDL